MSPLWSDMAIATALKAAEAAKRAAERRDDAERPLQRIGNGWSLKPADQAPRRPIRRRLASFAL